MKYKIDVSDETALIICECGWRTGPFNSVEDARDALISHERFVHPHDTNVRHAAQMRRLRNVTVAPTR